MNCLSPILFALFVSDLPAFMEGKFQCPFLGAKSVPVLQFADDTVLLGLTVRDLNRAIEVFLLYCAENGLTVNPRKTDILIFRARAVGRKMERWWVGNDLLECSRISDYLGVRFSTGRISRRHVLKLRDRGRVRSLSLIGVLKRIEFDDTRVVLQLFRSLVLSTMIYGMSSLLPLLNTCMIRKDLDPILFIFLRRYFSLPPGTPCSFLLRMSGMACVTCQIFFDGVLQLHRYCSRWGANSPLVEELLKILWIRLPAPIATNHLFVSDSWLHVLLVFIQSHLDLTCNISSFDDFRISFGSIPRSVLKSQLPLACSRFCYPLLTSHRRLFDLLVPMGPPLPGISAISSGNLWAARVAVCEQWRFTKDAVVFKSISKFCPTCMCRDSLQHWLGDCPDFVENRRLLRRAVDLFDVVGSSFIADFEFERLILSHAELADFSSFCWVGYEKRLSQWRALGPSAVELEDD
jgi:hypothetical protein